MSPSSGSDPRWGGDADGEVLIRAGEPGRIQEADMHVRFVSPAGVELYDAAELPTLLARDDGLVWVDVPVWDERAEQTLSSIFGFHPLAIRDSAHRNQVPKIHRYDDHLFVVLH